MTNQEAMRGRAREYIESRWLIPGTQTVTELAAEFALEEVASRDARIAELEQELGANKMFTALVKCKFCEQLLHLDKNQWVDSTEGDCCSGNDALENENQMHVPVSTSQSLEAPKEQP